MSQVIIVTGLSGAGKSTALHTLEDLGFFCVDNLPTVLAPQAEHIKYDDRDSQRQQGQRGREQDAH